MNEERKNTGTKEYSGTERIQKMLAGHPWQELVTAVECVDSSNNVCRKLAAAGAPEGTTIIARRQTAGRGRRGREFSSPPGGLYCSVILRPQARPEELLHLTAMTAVAAARAVCAAAGIYPGIKWTNDLVLNGRKLCGILTELSLDARTRMVEYAVVGIGINCEQVALPAETAAMATSLSAETGRQIDRDRLAAELLRELYALRQQLLVCRESWLREFAEHCVTLGREVRLVQGGTVREAFAEGIDEAAALLVRYPDGTRQAVNSGEVSVRGLYGYG